MYVYMYACKCNSSAEAESITRTKPTTKTWWKVHKSEKNRKTIDIGKNARQAEEGFYSYFLAARVLVSLSLHMQMQYICTYIHVYVSMCAFVRVRTRNVLEAATVIEQRQTDSSDNHKMHAPKSANQRKRNWNRNRNDQQIESEYRTAQCKENSHTHAYLCILHCNANTTNFYKRQNNWFGTKNCQESEWTSYVSYQCNVK